ncbi:hypothetical protein D3C71_1164740 [compost metagenome]
MSKNGYKNYISTLYQFEPLANDMKGHATSSIFINGSEAVLLDLLAHKEQALSERMRLSQACCAVQMGKGEQDP